MSVTVQTIPNEPSTTTLQDVNEFFVPTILSFNLKKTSEDRTPTMGADDLSSRQNGDSITDEDEDEDVMDKPAKGKETKSKQQTSSFLLEPFLKPVDPHIESNKENPVLKALFGGKSPPGLSPWVYLTKTSMNNCHPFKKTEFSHDLASDDTPIQIPKSLLRRPSKSRRKSSVSTCPSANSSDVKKASTDGNLTSNSAVTTPTAVVRSCPSPTSRIVSESQGFIQRKKSVLQQSNSNSPVVKSRIQTVNGDRLVQLRTLVDNAVKEAFGVICRVCGLINMSHTLLLLTTISELRISCEASKMKLLSPGKKAIVTVFPLQENHKVYSMTGCYNSVRNALRQRGWIEKIDSDVKGRRKVNRFEEIGLYDAAFQFVQKNPTVAAMRLTLQTNSGFAHNDQIRYTGQGEAEIINRMLRNVTEDLCWLSRPYPYYCWKDFDKFEMINRLPRAYFSNKVGLCNSLQQIQWFYESGVCSTQFPRTYNTSMKDELDAFRDDFRLTACIGLLKWFLQGYKSGGENAVRSADGKVDINVLEFSLRRCAEYVKTKQHEDIDMMDTPTVWDYQWDQFITQYYKIVNDGQILRDGKEGISIKAIASNVQSMLNILKPHWPQYDIDGYQNFWIVKPGGRCCGAGIVIRNNLEQILSIVHPSTLKETRYVVQKYIERPLLIYNTKFDIRQWFLVTNVYPLTVWMYRESYLRFCSQPFTLRNTHESIHLCNNAVQRKYRNGKRDRGLPDENMWDCYTFQTYLKAIGHPDVWEKYIYPGMKEGFIGALLASQESMERKKNCFELYGADFMISDVLTDGPWLIEINSNPAMDSSTSVTARMCPQVLEDIIKVVIDRRDNKSASTGAFEMVYRQNCPPIPPYLGMSLSIKGKKATKLADSKTLGRKSKGKYSSEPLLYTDGEEEQRDEGLKSPNVLKTPKGDASSSDEANSEQKFLKASVSNEKLNVKRQRETKRRKIDWIRKNIEDIKSFNAVKKNFLARPISHDESASSRSSQQEGFSPKVESPHSDQVIEFIKSTQVKEFFNEFLKLKKEREEEMKKGSIPPENQNAGRKSSDCGIDEVIREVAVHGKQNFLKILNGYQQKPESLKWDNMLEILNETAFRISLKSSVKSAPNFDTTFENELQKIEEKEEKAGRMTADDSADSFYSCISSTSVTNTKSSFDYFRDWKSKIMETRRTCEEMLARLHTFQEENSKVKFQDAMRKRIKDELEFIKRVRQYRKGLGVATVVDKRDQKEVSESKDKSRADDCRLSSKCLDGDGVDDLTPLAINSETGAVRSINDSLPKIKQRSRPLLPNGSSGHGRKINVVLEQPTLCH